MSAGGHGGWRLGSGRKPTVVGRRDITVTLDADSYGRLEAWAKALGLSRSETLRHLLARTPEPKKDKRKGER